MHAAGGGCLTSTRSTEDLGSSGAGLQGFGVDQPLRIHPGHPCLSDVIKNIELLVHTFSEILIITWPVTGVWKLNDYNVPLRVVRMHDSTVP